MLSETARAKINLTLHVGRLISEPSHQFYGYHPVDSLVVFANIGDRVSCEEADQTALEITGPFSNKLAPMPNNLILKAYDAVSEHYALPPMRFHLEKHLPIAAGIGGGSANAAAVLRLLKHYVDFNDAVWTDIATGLGADVPVCFTSQTAIIRGIGEDITTLPGRGTVPAIIVNPNVPVSTGEVFDAFDTDPHPERPATNNVAGSLKEIYLSGRNDLQPYTTRQYPKVAACLDVLRRLAGINPECVRMSGSGATCFVLCDTPEQADDVALTLSETHPDWWVKSVLFGSPDGS